MKKYKIVVLSDLDSSSHSILKSAVSLAQMINGKIEVFSAKSAMDTIKRENQLSANRTIHSERNAMDKKMRNLIAPLSLQYGIDISHSLAIGNVKNEITDFIETRQPDIVVLGKRKEKLLNFIGDKITQYVLNTFKGTIMIATDNNALEPNKEISLGMLNNLEPSNNMEFADNLIEHSQKPLKSFKIVQNSNLLKEVPDPANKKNIEYVFENGEGAIKGLSNYLSKNKINLLYVDRAKKSPNTKVNFIKADIRDIVNKLNVTLLITGDRNYNNSILTD